MSLQVHYHLSILQGSIQQGTLEACQFHETDGGVTATRHDAAQHALVGAAVGALIGQGTATAGESTVAIVNYAILLHWLAGAFTKGLEQNMSSSACT